MRVIITEAQFRDCILEETMSNSDIKKIIMDSPELKKEIKDAIDNVIKSDKNLEKKIKNVAADSIKTLYKILYQRSTFYDSELRS